MKRGLIACISHVAQVQTQLCKMGKLASDNLWLDAVEIQILDRALDGEHSEAHILAGLHSEDVVTSFGVDGHYALKVRRLLEIWQMQEDGACRHICTAGGCCLTSPYILLLCEDITGVHFCLRMQSA